jgi:type I restriction enzyme, S subunit
MEEWPKVRFGDVVQKMNGKIALEERAGKLCVRGEHIPREFPPDVENIIVDENYLGPAFHRTFEAGDVLFATRFPNLNKVGQPSFSGICANTTLVLRADEKNLDQELLPWIMKSAEFVSHCILNTRGSTNPYINWTQLAEYQFSLPPTEIQSSIIEKISISTDLINQICASEKNINQLFSTILKLNTEDFFAKFPSKKLHEVASVSRGKFSHRPRNLPEFYGGGIPFIQTGDIENADRYIEHYNYTLTKLGTTHSKKFPSKTIFMTIAANIGSTAICTEPVYATDSVVAIIPESGLDEEYLELILKNYKLFLEFGVATQTAQKNINLENIKPLKIPIPPLEVQRDFVTMMLALKEGSDKITMCRISSLNLINSVVSNYSKDVIL